MKRQPNNKRDQLARQILKQIKFEEWLGVKPKIRRSYSAHTIDHKKWIYTRFKHPKKHAYFLGSRRYHNENPAGRWKYFQRDKYSRLTP